MKQERAPERKFVSVLFADIKGSTELVVGLDPEDALARLEPVMRILGDAVHQFDGIVSNTQGDGMMAVFGAPAAVDDHAIRACLAALRIQEALPKLNGPQVRIGVNSGEVVLHNVSHDLTSIYNAAGPVVHIAQKIQAEAPPGGIFVSASCLALTGGIFEIQAVPNLRVVGLEGGVSISKLIGLGPMSRWRARAAAGLSPFVGRSVDLQILEDAAVPIGGSGVGSIVIEGEAGSGKSRLANEFLDRLRRRGWNSFEIAGELTSRRTAWSAASRLLLAMLGNERDAPGDFVDKLAASGSQGSEAGVAALRTLLGLATPADVWGDIERQRRNHLMAEAFVLAVTEKAGSFGGPTALLVDDEQWVDSESLEALDLLAKRSPAPRLLLVVARRPADAVRRAPSCTLTLSALDPKEARLLVDALVGFDARLETIKTRLIAHTGGMPLFIEEAVKHLIETGVLVRAPSGFDLRLPDAGIGIPPTIQGVLSARIDRLSPSSREAVQIAAVFGDPAPVADVAMVARSTTNMIEASFLELTNAKLMVAASPEAKAYVFAHDLIREVAYSSMVRDRRRMLHRLVLDHLALGEKDASAALLEALHRQAVGAEEWTKALGYARLAANKATEQSAYRSSIGFFEAALAAIEHIEPSRSLLEQEIDLRLEARIAFGATAELNKLVAYAKEAEAKAIRIGDARRALAAKMHKANALTYIGAADEALSAGEEALAAATAAQVPQIQIVASYILAGSNYTAGRFRKAAELIAAARERLPETERLGRIGTTGTTLVLLDVMETIARAWLGEFPGAEARLAEAISLATQTARPYDRAACAYGTVVSLIQRGRIEDSVAAGEAALRLLQEFDLRFFFPLVANHLGFALAEVGRADESVALLRESRQTARDLDQIASRANAEASLGYALMRLDRDAEAEATLMSSLQLSRQQGFNGVRIVAARYLSEVLAKRRDRNEDRESLLAEAMESASACQARPSIARCKFALARLRREQGDADGANLLASEAAAAFEDMAIQWPSSTTRPATIV